MEVVMKNELSYRHVVNAMKKGCEEVIIIFHQRYDGMFDMQSSMNTINYYARELGYVTMEYGENNQDEKSFGYLFKKGEE